MLQVMMYLCVKAADCRLYLSVRCMRNNEECCCFCKKVVTLVVAKEVDDHAFQHLRTASVIFDVGSGPSEGPSTLEYTNITVQGL